MSIDRPPSTATPADRYQALWAAGRRPDLDAFLLSEPPLVTSALADVLRVDQNERWRRGDPVAAEKYFDQFPALYEDAESALTVIYGEVLVRSDRGEIPQLTDFIGRFPQFAELLALQWEVHHALDSQAVGDTITTAPVRAPEAPVGPAIRGYDIEEYVGRGAAGVVYRARQLPLNRVVALKVILEGQHARPERLFRFMEEARLVARLRHPNVVSIYDLGQHESGPYMALEWVGGGTLVDWIKGEAVPARPAAEMMARIARAVGYAHAHGVVHRDLKPANVLLTSAGDPKVADFGLAKDLDLGGDGATQTGFPLGTALYMGPEQALGRKDIGPAADVYSMGAMLYEMVSGQVPLRGPTVRDTLRLVEEREPANPRAWNPSVPRDLATICLKCLEKKSAARYRNGDELADELERFLAGKPVAARPVGLFGRWVRAVNRNRGFAATTAVTFALLIAAAGFAGWAWDRAATEQQRADHFLVQWRSEIVRGDKELQEELAIPVVMKPDHNGLSVGKAGAVIVLSFGGRPVLELDAPDPDATVGLSADDGQWVVAESKGARRRWNVTVVRNKLHSHGCDW